MRLNYIVMLFAALALSGCSTGDNVVHETRIISTPSSKPYRYLKYSQQCPVPVIKAIKLHNETHWKVKQAEAKAKAAE